MTTETPSTEERLSNMNELARGYEALRADIRSFRNTMLALIGGVWATLVIGFIALFIKL